MKFKTLLTGLILLLCATTSNADELNIVPSIGFGQSFLSFKRTGLVDESRFNIVDLGLSASYGAYYLKVNTEMPLGQVYTASASAIRQYKREDFGATAGYYLNDNLSVFGGYAYGKTSVITNEPSNTVYTEHQDGGPFVGINYSLFLGKTGTLGLNLAYAYEDGSLKVVNTDSTPDTSESGRTDGYSLGATWTDTYKDKLTYYVGYKWKRYNTNLVGGTIKKTFDIFTFGFIFPI